MKREDIEALIPQAVDRLLRIWAQYMKRGKVGNGYPKRSFVVLSGGVNCWDDFEEEVDSGTATEVNTIMGDLDNRHYCAISNFYCAKVWNFRGDTPDFLLEAIADFGKRAQRRGLVM